MLLENIRFILSRPAEGKDRRVNLLRVSVIFLDTGNTVGSVNQSQECVFVKCDTNEANCGNGASRTLKFRFNALPALFAEV